MPKLSPEMQAVLDMLADKYVKKAWRWVKKKLKVT